MNISYVTELSFLRMFYVLHFIADNPIYQIKNKRITGMYVTFPMRVHFVSYRLRKHKLWYVKTA